MDLPNVIIVVFDTLRRDGLGCYGGKARTPNIDAFASDAVMLENAVSPASWTAPSHASLFTGSYPSSHGVHESRNEKVDAIPKLMKSYQGGRLATILKKKGYHSAAMSANPNISNGSGFEEGFSHFLDVQVLTHVTEEVEFIRNHVPLEIRGSLPDSLKYLVRKGKFLTLLEAYKKYRNVKKRMQMSQYPSNKGGHYINDFLNNSSYELPLFLFVNFMEMHEPYLPSRSDMVGGDTVRIQLMDLLGQKLYSPSKMRRIRQAYFAQSGVIDRNFGLFVRYLKNVNIYDDSLIILTSDHGQALHEHGFYGHGIFLTDELVRIPLIIKPPKNLRLDSKAQGWQSLSSVYEFVSNFVDGNRTLNTLCTSSVFSESYGIQNLLHQIPSGNDVTLAQTRETVDVPRKAVFKGDLKMVVEGMHGKIEELKKSGESINPYDHKESVRDLLEELDIFRGREDFKLPQI